MWRVKGVVEGGWDAYISIVGFYPAMAINCGE